MGIKINQLGIKINQYVYENKSRWESKKIKMGIKINQDGYQNKSR